MLSNGTVDKSTSWLSEICWTLGAKSPRSFSAAFLSTSCPRPPSSSFCSNFSRFFSTKSWAKERSQNWPIRCPESSYFFSSRFVKHTRLRPKTEARLENKSKKFTFSIVKNYLWYYYENIKKGVLCYVWTNTN